MEAKTEQRARLDPEVVRGIVTIKNDELREAWTRLRAVGEEVAEVEREANQTYVRLVDARRQAEAELEAHLAYKDAMPAQEYARDKRRLERARDAAKRQEEAHAASAQKRLRDLQKPLAEARAEAERLARQWAVHERRARDAGLDMEDFYAPPSVRAEA